MSDGWNHNSHHHDLLLRAVPRPCRRALDVGCGAGAFARRLAPLADHVDAIDREPAVLARARALSPAAGNVRFTEADFLSWPGGAYDFVSMIASLHHMPFAEALAKAARSLRPGGVLAVVGLYRERPLVDLMPIAVAFVASRFCRLTRPTSPFCAPTGDPTPPGAAPVRDPSMALGEIRRAAHELLPGAVFRRHLLWRYSIFWIKEGRDA